MNNYHVNWCARGEDGKLIFFSHTIDAETLNAMLQTMNMQDTISFHFFKVGTK